MKLQKLLVLISFFLISLYSFSQDKKETQKIDTTKIDTTKTDTTKLTYAKTKELLLTVIDSLNKNDSETLGTFTIKKLPVPIQENKTDREGVSKIKHRLLNLFVVNDFSKKKDNERKKIVKEYFKKRIDSLENKKINIGKTIALDTLMIDKSVKRRSKLLKEMDLLSKEIDFIKKNENSIFDDYFKSSKTSQDLIKLFLKKEKIWLVDNVEIEIREGSITDILVTLVEESSLESEKPTQRYFINKYPTSLAIYGRYINNVLNEKGKSKATIQLSDVLDYQHRMGKNYAPNDKTMTITRKKGSEKMTLDNNLNSFLDFRLYSDFLGLINETPNGIINFETSSKITINPVNTKNMHFIKSVTPFLKYSRFDNDDKKVLLDTIDSASIVRKLDLEQKAFIVAGAKFDLFEFKFSKETPFIIQIPFNVRVNIVEVDKRAVGNTNNFTVNTLVYGSGINFDFKKVNNFGLKLGLLAEGYDHKGNSDEIKRTPIFYTLGVSAELYYYDSSDSNSAFFLRLRANKILEFEENYTALQFGYKTSLNFSKTKN